MRSAAEGEHRTGDDRGRSLYPGALNRWAMRRSRDGFEELGDSQATERTAPCFRRHQRHAFIPAGGARSIAATPALARCRAQARYPGFVACACGACPKERARVQLGARVLGPHRRLRRCQIRLASEPRASHNACEAIVIIVEQRPTTHTASRLAMAARSVVAFTQHAHFVNENITHLGCFPKFAARWAAKVLQTSANPAALVPTARASAATPYA